MAEVLVNSVPRGGGLNHEDNTTINDTPNLQLVAKPSADMPLPLPSPNLTDGSGSEEDFYGEDGAQSFIQPAMSPAVTRLTSPKTPRAERVAAMDQAVESYFDGAHVSKDGDNDESSGDETTTPTTTTHNKHPRLQKKQQQPRVGKPVERTNLPADASIPPPQPQSEDCLPSPWRTTGPKQIVVTHSTSPASRPVLASVWGNSRQRRASSGGADALRRQC